MDVTYNLGISNCVKLLLNKFARLDNREDCLQFVREVELAVTNIRQKLRRRSLQHTSTVTDVAGQERRDSCLWTHHNSPFTSSAIANNTQYTASYLYVLPRSRLQKAKWPVQDRNSY